MSRTSWVRARVKMRARGLAGTDGGGDCFYFDVEAGLARLRGLLEVGAQPAD